MAQLLTTITLSELPNEQLSHHGAPIDFVHKRASNQVKYLLGELSKYLQPDYPRLLVEVKFWPELIAGQLPSGGAWHTDLRTDHVDPREEHHVIWQQGAGCFTEFKDMMAFDGATISYGRELHRATHATISGPRLLIRLSQSYTIRPHPNVFNVERFVQ